MKEQWRISNILFLERVLKVSLWEQKKKFKTLTIGVEKNEYEEFWKHSESGQV